MSTQVVDTTVLIVIREEHAGDVWPDAFVRVWFVTVGKERFVVCEAGESAERAIFGWDLSRDQAGFSVILCIRATFFPATRTVKPRLTTTVDDYMVLKHVGVVSGIELERRASVGD